MEKSEANWTDKSLKMGYSKVPIDAKAYFRRYQRKLDRIEKNLQNKVFPIKLEWIIWFMIGIGILNGIGFAPMNGTIDNLTNTLEYHFGSTIWNRIISITIIGAILSTITIFSIRLLFTLSLYYHGWLFEEIGKPISLSTKIFMFFIQFFDKYSTFFSFTELLPWQPIPSLNSTIERYLRSIKPLLTSEEYENVVKQSEEFKKTIGKELQRKLWLKWLTSRNYVSDWWKEVVYMRYRNSLINTNVGCADVIYQKTTNIQAARASTVILMRLHFLREVFQKQSFKPITLGGIPLCPNQYLDYYRTIRLPNDISDDFVRLPESKYIAVNCHGCWYKINVFYNRRLIRSIELEKCLQNIIDKKEKPIEKEEYMAALTAGPRELWSKIRKEKFSSGINAESLSFIENALEIVYLDDEEYFYDENDPSKYNEQYARALHGYGYKLWCDKPSVYYFSKNGKFMSNAEHSCVDAMVLVHIREYIKYHEHFSNPYLPDGHCRGEMEYLPIAERLKFEYDDETKNAIDEAYKFSKNVADDFENSSIIFKDYGKDFIKKAKVSPDAFIQCSLQMAYKKDQGNFVSPDAFIQCSLQMAYFKDQGNFGLTYEPAVMRLFKDGRTETVRSCSIESCNFVNSMTNDDINDKEKIDLLKKACEQHQDYYRNCMAGNGCDRHLFSLYVLSKYLQIKSDFLESIFNMPFVLSTSQTPQHQMSEYSKQLNKEKDLFWPAGGFCCPEGSNYGVCYTISGPGDCLSFHVSTWKSIKNTNAERFLGYIVESLRELHDLVERVQK
uniref:Choline/carnitine acyltransferase domain-containing protein n=1 Tax=Panagrolaimus sp. JU765 TaxID=591449 RepID=A0AC34RDR2_9BILA